MIVAWQMHNKPAVSLKASFNLAKTLQLRPRMEYRNDSFTSHAYTVNNTTVKKERRNPLHETMTNQRVKQESERERLYTKLLSNSFPIIEDFICNTTV